MSGPPKVTVKKVKWDAAQQRIWRRIAALGPRNVRAALSGIGDGIIAGWRGNIQRGRSAEGKFVPLSPRYAAAKLRRWGAQPILIASKELYDSFGYTVRQVGPSRWKVNVGAQGMHKGGTPNAVIAQAHIQGSSARASNMARASTLREAGREASRRGDRNLGRRLSKRARALGSRGGLPRRNFAAMPAGFMARLQSTVLRRILSAGR